MSREGFSRYKNKEFRILPKKDNFRKYFQEISRAFGGAICCTFMYVKIVCSSFDLKCDDSYEKIDCEAVKALHGHGVWRDFTTEKAS